MRNTYTAKLIAYSYNSSELKINRYALRKSRKNGMDELLALATEVRDMEFLSTRWDAMER